MDRARVIVAGVTCLLAGCGTLLDIQPDGPPPGADGGMTSNDASPAASPDAVAAAEGGDAGALDAADAGPTPLPDCTSAAVHETCTLATGIANLGTIAVGNGYVYFAHYAANGPIDKVPTTGGAVTAFASGGNMPAGLFASPSAVYWVTSDDVVARQQWDASTPQATANGGSSPAAQVVAVGTDTYWTIPGSGVNGVVQASGPGLSSGASIVTMAAFPTALAADAVYVYYASKSAAGHIARVPVGAGSTTSSASPYKNIGAIALSTAGGGIVAFASEDGVYRTSTTSDTAFMSSWVKVSSETTGVGLVADDGGTLWVLSASGTLVTIANAAPPAFSDKQVPGCSVGRALAQDATNVYLACNDTIIRVSKLP